LGKTNSKLIRAIIGTEEEGEEEEEAEEEEEEEFFELDRRQPC